MSTFATSAGHRAAVHTPFLAPGTRIATALAVLLAQVGLAIPAVLNGLFQEDLHTTSAQLTWISDAFLVPVTLLELSFGVVGGSLPARPGRHSGPTSVRAGSSTARPPGRPPCPAPAHLLL